LALIFFREKFVQEKIGIARVPFPPIVTEGRNIFLLTSIF